ncbi:hypothetical protein D3C85_903740 [compost metagenome]
MQQAGFVAQHDALCTGLDQPCSRCRIVGIAVLTIINIGQGDCDRQAVGQGHVHGAVQTLEIQLRIDQNDLADAMPGEHSQPGVQGLARQHIDIAMGRQQIHRGAQRRAIGALAQRSNALQRVFLTADALGDHRRAQDFDGGKTRVPQRVHRPQQHRGAGGTAPDGGLAVTEADIDQSSHVHARSLACFNACLRAGTNTSSTQRVVTRPATKSG